MQVIQRGYYKDRAMASQLKQSLIKAERGTISFTSSNGDLVPAVLNQTLYTIYADPVLIKDDAKVADILAKELDGDIGDIKKQLGTENTRYVILKKKVSEAVRNKIMKHKLAGIGAQSQSYRVYPQGQLASQLMGFVDDDGVGRYGIEQALNKELSGKDGLLKAVTDINGVPLASSKGNIQKPAENGESLALSIDIGMQQQLENILKKRADLTKTEIASAVIIEVDSGRVKAMANYPTYDPSDISAISSAEILNNASVSHPIEIGSIMKSLTVAAGLDSGVVNRNSSYFDPSFIEIDGFKVKNVEEDGGPGSKNLYDLLNLSLNTGATWLLEQMGGGKINQKARDTWHMYMSDRFRFGKPTGIEQGYEASGLIPSPDDNGAGINLTYANTAFGQAMTATPIQTASALSAALNGGIYYQPSLILGKVSSDGKLVKNDPKVLSKEVVKSGVAEDLESMLVYSVEHHTFAKRFDQEKYTVGGKTGTAQLALPGGGYSEADFNGTYLGFVGGSKPKYVISVMMIKPKVNYYAGTAAAMPVFGDLAHMLIDNAYVTPK